MLFGYASTASNFTNTYVNITQTTSNYGNMYGLIYNVNSGYVMFNNTTVSFNASCPSCSYLNLGVFTVYNTGVKVTFYNGSFSLKFYYSGYYSYLCFFSYNTYSYANMTVWNVSYNISNGTGYGYIYGNSYLYGGGMGYLQSYANYTVYNSTFYFLLYMYNYQN